MLLTEIFTWYVRLLQLLGSEAKVEAKVFEPSTGERTLHGKHYHYSIIDLKLVSEAFARTKIDILTKWIQTAGKGSTWGKFLEFQIFQNALKLQNNEMFSQYIDIISPVSYQLEGCESVILDFEKYNPKSAFWMSL